MPDYIERENSLFVPEDASALLVINPTSKRMADAELLIKHLVGTGQMDESGVVETAACREETARRVQTATEKYQPSVVIAATGDGTIATVGNSLLTSSNPSVRETAIYAANYATAGNIHKATQDTHSRTDITIANQPVVTTYPMEVTVRRPGEPTEALRAISCASLGMTALIGDMVNLREHRESLLHDVPGGKKLREALTAVRALALTKRFTIVEPTGNMALVSTLLFANSDPIGTQWGFGGDLTKPVIRRLTAENRRKTINQMIQLKLGKLSAEAQFAPYSFTVVSEPNPELEVWMEHDGEAGHIPNGTKVTVAPAGPNGTLRFVSDRLHRLHSGSRS